MVNKILLLFSFLTVAAQLSKASDPNPNNLSFTEQMELAMRLSQQENTSSANSNTSPSNSSTSSKAPHELTFTEQMELAMRLSQQESSPSIPAPLINSNASSSTSSAVKNAAPSSASNMSYAEQMRLALKQSEEEARVAELKRIEEEDRKLALQLAGGQTTRTSSSSSVAQDSYNAFVRQFEEQERLNGGSLNGIRIATKDYSNFVRLFKSRIEALEKQKVDINALRFIYNEYKRTVPVMDSNHQSVHTFNLQFVNNHASKVMSLEQVTIKSAKNIPFDNVAQAVHGFLGINQHQTDKQAQVLKALSMLKAYLIETPIDTETGLNMAHLLSQVYDLVQHCDATRNIFSLPNGTSVDAMEYFIYSLQENLTTQGGCKPGMAGRLFRDYLLLSSSILELREKDLLRQIEIYRRHVADFQQ